MIELKKNTKTLRNFKEAIRATGGLVNNSFKNPLSLVGVFYDTVFVPRSILAEPTIAITDLDSSSDIITLGMSLKPMPEDAGALKTLHNVINTLSMGDIFTNPITFPKASKHFTPMQTYLTQNTSLSEVQNYDVRLVMNEPVVERIDTTINGTKYWQYTLTDIMTRGESEVFRHSAHFLFKERTSEGENFFSSLVGKDLSKRDAEKVMDSLADKNISGLFLGGILIGIPNREARGVTSSMYAVGAEMSLRDREDKYEFKTLSGAVTVNKKDIESLRVKRTGDYKYTLILNTAKEEIVLYIG